MSITWWQNFELWKTWLKLSSWRTRYRFLYRTISNWEGCQLFVFLIILSYFLQLVKNLEWIWEVWNVVVLRQVQSSVAAKQESSHKIEHAHNLVNQDFRLARLGSGPRGHLSLVVNPYLGPKASESCVFFERWFFVSWPRTWFVFSCWGFEICYWQGISERWKVACFQWETLRICFSKQTSVSFSPSFSGQSLPR